MRKNHCLKSVQIRSFFWSAFSRIWTEYGDLRSNSPYSVRIRENTDQRKLRIWTLFTQWTWLVKLTLTVHQSSLLDCQLFNWPWHCVKSVQIRSFFWSVFSPNAGKYGPEKTPYLDTFHTVWWIIDHGSTSITKKWFS